MAYCEKCKSTNVIESESGNYCCNCGWDSTKKEYVKKQTNADRIRSMSDEELAELFTKLAWNSEVQTTPLKYLDWLQSEAE